MKLDFKKTFYALQALPKTGSISDQLIGKDLAKRLTAKYEELKPIVEFVQHPNGFGEFKSALDLPFEFELSEAENHVLKRGVKMLDDNEQVPLEMAEFCSEVLSM